MDKRIATTLSFLIVGLIIVIGMWHLIFSQTEPSLTSVNPDAVFCTMEAKICPDGSAVGRTGPHCEFSPCPVPTQTLPLKNTPITFTFPTPTPLTTTYISGLIDIHPEVTVSSSTFSCPVEINANPQTAKVEQKTINQTTYCIHSLSEGAAGSTYSSYTYTTTNKDRLISLAFTIRIPNCNNFDEPKKTACEREQKTFNVDTVADKIIKTIQFN